MSGYTAFVAMLVPSLEMGPQFKMKDIVQMDLIHCPA